MNKIEDILNYIKTNKDTSVITNNFDMLMENVLSSLVNNIKNDAGNYDELEKIKQLKKEISNESRKQYKLIISFCEDSKKANLISALKLYNIWHFFKLIIRILDINDDYTIKVKECKKYFGSPAKVNFYKYLYEHREASINELKQLPEHNSDFLAPSSHIYDLVATRRENDMVLYSLSPKGKNLYAFFMIKNIDFDNMALNSNEGKVNEVLEYLIEYILNKSDQNHYKLKKPQLNSVSANDNLNKLTYLLDEEKNYHQDIFQFSDEKTDSSINWTGEKLWKTNY